MSDPRHYVLLTDSDNNSLLVSCTDPQESLALAHAAVFSDGGVSAWLWPEDTMRFDSRMLDQLQEGEDIAYLVEGRTAHPITLTEEPTDG